MIGRAMIPLMVVVFVLDGMHPWGYHEALPAAARSLGAGSRP
jgi:hypothetical protein